MKRYIIVIALISGIFTASAYPEKEIIDLAGDYQKKEQYYNTITELMRYQYLYPDGEYYPLSILMMGEAYFKGGNYYKAVSSMSECYEKFSSAPEGEKALFNLGYMRLVMGSPYFALRSYQEYSYIFKDGRYIEDAYRGICYARLLMYDIPGADEAITDYRNQFPDGKYIQNVKELQILIDKEINRPRKSIWISVLGSVFIPGFGHMYTGKIMTGIFSLLTNITLIYLTYDGYRDRNTTQTVIFGFAELIFYQHSLYSSIRNVYEYNSSDAFLKSVKLSLTEEF